MCRSLLDRLVAGVFVRCNNEAFPRISQPSRPLAPPERTKLHSPLLELLVVRSLLDQVEDLPSVNCRRNLGAKPTWFVNCALASGKALGFGVDMMLLLVVLFCG